MPVGQHVANLPAQHNAYRVLGPDGKPRPDFRWSDPGDARDVRDVLEADGVRFRANGAADPSQRITAAELAALIDVLDDDAIEQAKRPRRRAVRAAGMGMGAVQQPNSGSPMTGSPSAARWSASSAKSSPK